MIRLSAALVAMLAAAAAAGCSGAGSPLPLPPREAALLDADDFDEAVDELAEPDRDSFLVAELRLAGLTPAVGGRFTLASGITVAFVPGRHPVRGNERVVVVASGVAAGAAVLEEARLLAAHAAYSAAPERTVMVAFLPPRTAAGLATLEAVLGAPLWTDSLTVAALVVEVGVEGRDFAGVTAVRGVPIVHVTVPASAGGAAEAVVLTRALRPLLDAAANGAPARPDVEGRREGIEDRE